MDGFVHLDHQPYYELFWHFDIFQKRYWEIIGDFWREGGVIDQPSEYMFLFTLLMIVPVWVWGFKKPKNYLTSKLFSFRFWYHDYIGRKYAGQPTHIVLKNMGGGKVKNRRRSK